MATGRHTAWASVVLVLSLSAARAAEAGGATPIDIGENVFAGIDVVEEHDLYTFDAAAGDVIWIRMAQEGSFIEPRLELTAPGGDVIANGSEGSTISDILDLPLVETGTYTLDASDAFDDETGGYSVQVVRIGDGAPVDFGPPACAAVEANADRDVYTFDAAAGDLVWLRVSTLTATQPRTRLYGPDDAFLVAGAGTNTTSDVLDFVMPATGTYTLVVYSNNFNAGAYCEHLLRISDPVDDVLIEYGPVYADAIATMGEIDAFTFDVAAGDVVWLRMARRSLIECRLRLYDPAGNFIASGSGSTIANVIDFTLPSTGTYTLLAYDQALDQPGAYTLHLLRENDPTDAVALTLGSEQCASLEDGAIDAYTFPALAGDSIRARMSEESAALEPRLRLLDPDGRVIIGGSGNSEVELLASDLPADGVYKLLAYDDVSDDPGDYRVEVELCVDDPCGDFCPGDVTNDRVVGFADLLVVLSAWGSCACCPGDIDGNGAVEFGDLFIVLSAWGPCL